MSEFNNNIKISGSGSAGGGRYDEVKISGSGQINGDIECNNFHTSGSSKVNGKIKTVTFSTSGSTHVTGDVLSEEFKISGSSKILGDIRSNSVRVSGSTHVEGAVHSEDVHISGSISIGKDCEAERFTSKGGFKINGLLNAGNIDISIGGRCFAKEIGGEKIEVRQEGIFIINRFINQIFNNVIGLETDIIEGDDIYLEYTKAKTVRGNNVTIGKGCIIENVEYKNKLNVLENGKVENQTNI